MLHYENACSMKKIVKKFNSAETVFANLGETRPVKTSALNWTTVVPVEL